MDHIAYCSTVPLFLIRYTKTGQLPEHRNGGTLQTETGTRCQRALAAVCSIDERNGRGDDGKQKRLPYWLSVEWWRKWKISRVYVVTQKWVPNQKTKIHFLSRSLPSDPTYIMVSISVNNGRIKTMSGVLESSRAALSIGSTCILIGRLFENRLG